MPEIEVTRTYVEMRAPDALRPASSSNPNVRVVRAERCPPSFYRYLYAEVGRRHHWRDRAAWGDDAIRAHLARPAISLWVLYSGGAPGGYFELERHADGSVEIAYFGLLPDQMRQGLGKHLLTVAAREAWNAGATRVWLHTCTLDDPAALPNYVRRGFTPYREERYRVTIPDGGSS